MMIIDMRRETLEITMSVIWGQGLVPGAHAGKLLRAGNVLVALKIINVADSIDKTIKLQLKFTPLKTILAKRTRTFTFCDEQPS